MPVYLEGDLSAWWGTSSSRRARCWGLIDSRCRHQKNRVDLPGICRRTRLPKELYCWRQSPVEREYTTWSVPALSGWELKSQYGHFLAAPRKCVEPEGAGVRVRLYALIVCLNIKRFQLSAGPSAMTDTVLYRLWQLRGTLFMFG